MSHDDVEASTASDVDVETEATGATCRYIHDMQWFSVTAADEYELPTGAISNGPTRRVIGLGRKTCR